MFFLSLLAMSRELRICPRVGSRKCGAFLSTLDRNPHPTCISCNAKVCTIDMTCDICADWSYKDRKKASRPSGSVPLRRWLFPVRKLLRESRTLGLLQLLFPALQVVRGRGRGLGMHLVLCPGWALLPSRWISVQREGWECFWTVVGCARVRSRFSGSFGSWRSGSCSFAADFPCPLRFLGSLSLHSSLHARRCGELRETSEDRSRMLSSRGS